jgi:hypothetical protein
MPGLTSHTAAGTLRGAVVALMVPWSPRLADDAMVVLVLARSRGIEHARA